MNRLLLSLALVTACRPSTSAAAPTIETHLGGHPRLWIRAADVPRLRGWASRGNAVWQALAGVAEAARGDMDQNKVATGNNCMDANGVQPCESYAELFAFMSLVSPSEKERADYGKRAVRLLMAMISRAQKGPKEDDELRSHMFPVDDRSRWFGEGFALTVDWIYPLLSADDKRAIRGVFLRWAEDITHASVTDNNHPEPIGVLDDPKLLADRGRVRWAGNNYFTAHTRNLAMMALSLDDADDAGGALRAYVKRATGAWLYMIDALLRGDARGGLPPDGLEYGPQTYAYVAQALLALHTAGADDVSRYGRQARMDANPFWRDLVEGWPHLMSPATVEHEWAGTVYQPAWWGEGQKYFAPDPIDVFAPIALYDHSVGDERGAEAARWVALNLAPGGAAGAVNRVAKTESFRKAILTFLIMDPKAPPPADPRRNTSFVAPGLGKIFARTDWSPRATFFDYMLNWISVDHQHADGNSFDWYRKGEWLVKERTGYGTHVTSSDAHDTVCIENSQPYHTKGSPKDYRNVYWKRGSQWTNNDKDEVDPKLVAHSENARYVYALGEATGLYNSNHEEIHDCAHASRAIVWLVPDHVVVLDRAATKVDGRFKRFFLQLIARPSVNGRRATLKTPRGQLLHVNTLLPADAKISSEAAETFEDNEPAEGDPIRARLKVESWSRDVRFLHVLQAADGGKPEEPALVDAGPSLLAATAGSTVVVFPKDFGAAVAEVSFAPPAGARAVLVTGLTPNGEYQLSRAGGRVRITPGKGARADGGGALWQSL